MAITSPAISRRRALQFAGATALSGLVGGGMRDSVAASVPTELSGATVSLLADAMRGIGYDPIKLTMDPAIKPFSGGDGTMIGPAMTTKWEVGRGRMTREDVMDYIYEPLDAASPGTVWVIASGTHRILSMFGDIIAQALRRDEFAGAVTDSGFRDLIRIRELGFPVFAKGTVPHGPGDFIRPVAANVPVVCGGVQVEPGDLVAGDIDGVIVIPAAAVDKLRPEVTAHFAKEQRQRRQIDDGAGLVESH